jgi:hypothetical protein
VTGQRETTVQAAMKLIQRGQYVGAPGPLLEWALAQDQAAGRRDRSGRQVSASAPGSSAGEDEFDRLFPPKSAAAAEARFRAAERRSAAVAAMPDRELHAALFGSTTFEAATDSMTHDEFTGRHSHSHSDYRGGQHSHAHTHDGEADHGSGEHMAEPSHSLTEQGH